MQLSLLKDLLQISYVSGHTHCDFTLLLLFQFMMGLVLGINVKPLKFIVIIE